MFKREVVEHGGGGAVWYKKKLKSLYIRTKKCSNRQKKSRLLIFVKQI